MTPSSNSKGSTDYVRLLKACSEQQDLPNGTRLHAHILRAGLLEINSYLGSTLINMYVKCDAISRAVQVLDELPVRNAFSWSALISGYARHGRGEEALTCFEIMLAEGISPDRVTFICILKACASIGALDKGNQVHDEIVKRGLLPNDAMLGNTLVDMYVKCGALAKAAQLVKVLDCRDVVTWNCLIAGYVLHGQADEAMNSYEQMQGEGLCPDIVTFISILKACVTLGAADRGEEVCYLISRQGLLGKDVGLDTALVDMYAKCGVLSKAAQVLDKLLSRDVVTWNALITGYVLHGEAEEAIKCFEQMQCEGITPNAVTFTCILKACGDLGAVNTCEKIYTEISRRGLLEKYIALGNTLVNVYIRCGAFAKAAQLFVELPVRDVFSWSAMISGYAEQGWGEKALNCFEEMQWEGVPPDIVILTCLLKVCGSLQALDIGQHIHDEITRHGVLSKDTILGATLVDMYAKCGALDKAAQLLTEFSIKDVVAWNVLISAYTQQDKGEEALRLFENMKNEGLLPAAVTFICILRACGSIGAADRGEEICHEVVRQGLLVDDVVLGTALVDMYGKFGMLGKAVQVHRELHVHNVVSWNALIVGYAQVGQAEKALDCIQQMQCEGLSPDSVTFACLLSACNRAYLMAKSRFYFKEKGTGYNIALDVEHQSCIVDLLGRAGEFGEALALIKEMPNDHLPVWHSLLSTCQDCGNVELGRFAFDHAIQTDKSDAAAYVLMKRIYASVGMQEDANKLEVMQTNINIVGGFLNTVVPMHS